MPAGAEVLAGFFFWLMIFRQDAKSAEEFTTKHTKPTKENEAKGNARPNDSHFSRRDAEHAKEKT